MKATKFCVSGHKEHILSIASHTSFMTIPHPKGDILPFVSHLILKLLFLGTGGTTPSFRIIRWYPLHLEEFTLESVVVM